MKIRRITPEDYQDLYSIRLEALETNPEAFGSSADETHERGKEAYRKMIPSDKAGAIFVADSEDDGFVGMIGIQQEKSLKRQHKAFIWGMYVSPMARKRGIGQKLMAAALEFARANDQIKKVILSVNDASEGPKRLYEKFGFRAYGLEKDALNISGRYYSEELMELVL